jgi:hypothetical protein
VTAAASTGQTSGDHSFLCLPGAASTTEPFLTGTDLSCAP